MNYAKIQCSHKILTCTAKPSFHWSGTVWVGHYGYVSEASQKKHSILLCGHFGLGVPSTWSAFEKVELNLFYLLNL